MYRVTVMYGHPQDPEAFERYYREVHIPTALKMKGLTGLTAGTVESLDPAQKPPYYRLACLYFENADAMRAILSSPEGQATVADLHNFATGGVTILGDAEEVLIPVQLVASEARVV